MRGALGPRRGRPRAARARDRPASRPSRRPRQLAAPSAASWARSSLATATAPLREPLAVVGRELGGPLGGRPGLDGGERGQLGGLCPDLAGDRGGLRRDAAIIASSWAIHCAVCGCRVGPWAAPASRLRDRPRLPEAARRRPGRRLDRRSRRRGRGLLLASLGASFGPGGGRSRCSVPSHCARDSGNSLAVARRPGRHSSDSGSTSTLHGAPGGGSQQRNRVRATKDDVEPPAVSRAARCRRAPGPPPGPAGRAPPPGSGAAPPSRSPPARPRRARAGRPSASPAARTGASRTAPAAPAPRRRRRRRRARRPRGWRDGPGR